MATNNPFYSDAATIAKLNALTGLLNSGYLAIYTGTQPGDANQPISGTLLAKLPLSSAAFQTAIASGTDGLNSAAAPVVTNATSGGTVAVGTYLAAVTYVNAAGESLASLTGSTTTTTATSTLTIPSPAAQSNATGWYAYVSQAGGSTLTRQQTLGSPTAIGTNLTLTAPPSSGGANPPGSNTTSSRIVTANANTITSVAAVATGTAGYFALLKSDGLTAEIMGSVAVSGADLNFNSLSIISGNLVTCSAFSITSVE